jgi:hypothetical protein
VAGKELIAEAGAAEEVGVVANPDGRTIIRVMSG